MVKAIWQVIGVSAALHVALVAYSVWHDRNFQFKYTDLDYWVFVDGARAVAAGLPPYARATYRYTPLLAWILLPGTLGGSGFSALLEASFGKLLFSAMDLVVGFLIYRLLRVKGWHSLDAARHSAFFWLLNPVALAISTRGNAESLVCAVVLGVVYLLLTRQRLGAALLFGVAVHFKLFPIIYTPSILLFLGLYHRNAKKGPLATGNSGSASVLRMNAIPSGTQSMVLGTSASVAASSSQAGIGLRGLSPLGGMGGGIRLSASPLIRSASPNRLAESLSIASVGLGGAMAASAASTGNASQSMLLNHRRHQTSPVKTMIVSRLSAASQYAEDAMNQDSASLDSGHRSGLSTEPVRLSQSGMKMAIYPPSRVLLSLFGGRITLKYSHVAFGLASLGVFAGLTALSLACYGRMFWEEALLYHLTRKDHRHNFSPYFLPFYLEAVQSLPAWLPLAAFLPQLLLLLAIACKYARRDLPFAAFLQTLVFVTFNKVCTSQYFLWYLCFVPVVSTSLRRMTGLKWLAIGAVWMAAQAVWLYYNYLFEQLGRNTFVEMWMAALAFFVVNCGIAVFFVSHHYSVRA